MFSWIFKTSVAVCSAPGRNGQGMRNTRCPRPFAGMKAYFFFSSLDERLPVRKGKIGV